MIRNRKNIYLYALGFILVLALAGVAYAAFSDKGKVLGSSFSVGSADIKLLKDTAQGTDTTNLTDELAGPVFVNIGQNWEKDYLIKIYNNGTYNMALVSHANYETINDPEDLRQYIFAEIFVWDDTDSNGMYDEGELGTSIGRKTIIKWKTEGFDLGTFEPGGVKSYIIRFSTETMPDTKQGTQGTFDFEFDSIEI